jgi:hypothetical protein
LVVADGRDAAVRGQVVPQLQQVIFRGNWRDIKNGLNPNNYKYLNVFK